MKIVYEVTQRKESSEIEYSPYKIQEKSVLEQGEDVYGVIYTEWNCNRDTEMKIYLMKPDYKKSKSKKVKEIEVHKYIHLATFKMSFSSLDEFIDTYKLLPNHVIDNKFIIFIQKFMEKVRKVPHFYMDKMILNFSIKVNGVIYDMRAFNPNESLLNAIEVIKFEDR